MPMDPERLSLLRRALLRPSQEIASYTLNADGGGDVFHLVDELLADRDLRPEASAADPTSAAFARLRAQIEALKRLNSDSRMRYAKAESELARWKARCYPTPTDVADAKVTRAKCEAWMDATFDWVPNANMGRPAWTDPNDPGLMVQAVWRSTEREHQAEIAALIEWAADGQGRDQWQVLAEMAAMEVTT